MEEDKTLQYPPGVILDPETHRVCNECVEVKHLTEFRKHKSGYRYICRECYNKNYIQHAEKYKCDYVFKYGASKGKVCGKSSLAPKCSAHNDKTKAAQRACYERTRNKKEQANKAVVVELIPPMTIYQDN
jgi:hypothetical protein